MREGERIYQDDISLSLYLYAPTHQLQVVRSSVHHLDVSYILSPRLFYADNELVHFLVYYCVGMVSFPYRLSSSHGNGTNTKGVTAEISVFFVFDQVLELLCAYLARVRSRLGCMGGSYPHPLVHTNNRESCRE